MRPHWRHRQDRPRCSVASRIPAVRGCLAPLLLLELSTAVVAIVGDTPKRLFPA
uniref:hypothetical protein n=1 Tax=Streptomyces cellulosae TaxID=1968 RepID=UPI002F90B30D